MRSASLGLAGSEEREKNWCASLRPFARMFLGKDQAMVSKSIPAHLRRLEIPGKLTFLEGNGELTKIEVTTDYSAAEIYLYGAHVTDFRRKGERRCCSPAPVGRFKEGQPIRGGIPIIFPWFGPRKGNRHTGSPGSRNGNCTRQQPSRTVV